MEVTDPQPEVVVRASALGLRTKSGVHFADLDFEVRRGELFVITGPARSGKTALSLAIAGRLRTTEGALDVLGHALPREAGSVRRSVAITGNSTVTPLDDNLSVRQHIAEAITLAGPWWHPWTSAARVSAVVDRVNDVIVATGSGADEAERLTPLRPDELVADVGPLPRLVLSIVLALLTRPRVLVVDDVDALREYGDRRLAWHALATLQDADLTVIATSENTPELREARRVGVFDELPDDSSFRRTLVEYPLVPERAAARDARPTPTTATRKGL